MMSDSTTIVFSTLRSAKALSDLIQSYQDYPETVENLKIEVYGLLVVLKRIKQLSLDETTVAELEPILNACDKACSGLRHAIEKCTSHSGGRECHLGDWTKMKFLGGSITDAKETLAGYKATITVIISSVNLDTTQMTSQYLAEYICKILETNSQLSTLLQHLGQRSPARAEEQDDIKEVQTAIMKCISACCKVGNNIERVRKSLDDPSTTHGPGKGTRGHEIYQMTNKQLGDIQQLVSQYASQLQETNEEGQTQSLERQYYARSVQHCMSVMEKKAEQAQGYSIEGVSCKTNGIQIITTRSAKNLSVKNVHVESYGSQIMGEHESGTIGKLIENHSFRPITTLTVPRRRFLGLIPIGRRNVSNKS